MNQVKTLLLLGISLVLVSCGGGGEQATTPTTEASPTAEASPITEASPTAEASPTEAASPGEPQMAAIPIAVFFIIDVDKDGNVTEKEYVDYYMEKAEPKLSKADATKNFEALKPKEGKISKDMAK